MMDALRKMTPAEFRAFGIEAGFLDADGSHKRPEGDPCVSRPG
jgi:hypothetical protein